MMTSLVYRLLTVLMDYHMYCGCIKMTEFQRLVAQIQTESVVLDQWIAEKDASSTESQHQVCTTNF